MSKKETSPQQHQKKKNVGLEKKQSFSFNILLPLKQNIKGNKIATIINANKFLFYSRITLSFLKE